MGPLQRLGKPQWRNAVAGFIRRYDTCATASDAPTNASANETT